MRRLLLALALAALAHPAFALDPCFADSAGSWRGSVLDSGVRKLLDTEYFVAPDDTLVGRYHVFGDDPYDGVLTGFHATAECEADFVWQDRYGQGVVHVRFEPEQGRFLGAWGTIAPFFGHYFNGFRRGPAAVS